MHTFINAIFEIKFGKSYRCFRRVGCRLHPYRLIHGSVLIVVIDGHMLCLHKWMFLISDHNPQHAVPLVNVTSFMGSCCSERLPDLRKRFGNCVHMSERAEIHDSLVFTETGNYMV